MTVRARLAAFNVLVVALILVATGLFVRLRVRANLIDEIDRDLRADTSTVKTGKAASPAPPPGMRLMAHPPTVAERHVMEVMRANGGEVRLEKTWDAPRIIPAGERSLPGLTPEDPAALGHTAPFSHDFVRRGEPMRSLTVPIRQGGRVVAYVQAVRSLAPVHRQMADLDRALAASAPIALALASVGGFVLVGGALRPLRRMNEAAQRLAFDPKAARLPVEGHDEFADLATHMNAAFDRQAQILAGLERFTGDAGHELRTPLATVKANASFLLQVAEPPEALRPPLERIDASADRMARLIDDLLLLARQDAGRRTVQNSSLDLGVLLRDAADRLPNPRGVALDLRGEGTVGADADAVERTLLNLLSNALRHARSCVEVDASVRDDRLTLGVRDDGEGIAPEHLARLGERFYRPDEARAREGGGVGLGLAIVRSLADSLTFESVPGQGTVVRATFPCQK